MSAMADSTYLRRGKDSNGLAWKDSKVNSELKQLRAMEKTEREELVLYRRPLRTLYYLVLELGCLLSTLFTKLLNRKQLVFLSLLVVGLLVFLYRTEGPHQPAVRSVEKLLIISAYWAGLGILSSVGLGTGLHTFILYLGPFIAQVTLAAYECMSVKFPEPPYPNEIVCPEKAEASISMWNIMSKVRLEAIMWGAGTAIGELPPYFMARAARLSGAEADEEDLEELEELILETKIHPQDLGFVERAKIYIHNLVQRVGFFGILACASIPNPLFDLAGITCGHFLVPFWTFFGATLIGKAIIKMHIQKLFVIFIFSEHHVENVVKLIGYIPRMGPTLQAPFKTWLAVQKEKLHHPPGTAIQEEGNILGWIFEKVVIVMVIYFIISIVHSLAQNYHKRLCKARRAVDETLSVKKVTKRT